MTTGRPPGALPECLAPADAADRAAARHASATAPDRPDPTSSQREGDSSRCRCWSPSRRRTRLLWRNQSTDTAVGPADGRPAWRRSRTPSTRSAENSTRRASTPRLSPPPAQAKPSPLCQEAEALFAASA